MNLTFKRVICVEHPSFINFIKELLYEKPKGYEYEKMHMIVSQTSYVLNVSEFFEEIGFPYCLKAVAHDMGATYIYIPVIQNRNEKHYVKFYSKLCRPLHTAYTLKCGSNDFICFNAKTGMLEVTVGRRVHKFETILFDMTPTLFREYHTMDKPSVYLRNVFLNKIEKK